MVAKANSAYFESVLDVLNTIQASSRGLELVITFAATDHLFSCKARTEPTVF